MAQRYHTTPSANLGIVGTDPATCYWAWAIDQACAIAAQHDEEQRKVKETKDKQAQELRKLLTLG